MLLKVDNSPETNGCAPHLANKFGITIIENIKEKACFQNTPDDLSEIVCLSHASTKGLGDYQNAKAFVAKFREVFEARFGKSNNAKAAIKNLHLVGCEVGLTTNGQSLAQSIADELYANGFTAVNVHAIRNPAGTTPHAMRVKIMTKAGAKLGQSPGDVEAFWLTQEQETRLDTIERGLATELPSQGSREKSTQVAVDMRARKADRSAFYANKGKLSEEEAQLYQELRDNQQRFLTTPDIRAHLYTRANTVLSRNTSLQEDPAKLAAIRTIEARQTALKQKGDKKKAAQLTPLLELLRNDLSQDWRKHIEVVADNFKSKSTTKAVLKKLMQPKANEGDEIFGKTVESRKEPVVKKSHRRGSESDSTQSTDSDSDEQKHLMKAPISNPLSPVKRVLQENEATTIKKAIGDYVKVLENEAVNRGCSLFFGHIGKYKLSKFRELKNKVDGMDSVIKIKEAVSETFTSSSVIKWGTTHRAEYLVANILQGKAEKGTNAPDRPLQDQDYVPKL